MSSISMQICYKEKANINASQNEAYDASQERGQLTGSEVLHLVTPYISTPCDLYDLILHNSWLDKQVEDTGDDKDEAKGS
jgi:hypothetical protein